MRVDNLVISSPNALLVQGISVPLAAGTCTALVGESGSGKSLTALALMDLLPPNLEAEGEGLDSVRTLRRAMVFQEPMTALNPTMRVGAQIVEAAIARGAEPTEAKAKAQGRMVSKAQMASSVMDPT